MVVGNDSLVVGKVNDLLVVIRRGEGVWEREGCIGETEGE